MRRAPRQRGGMFHKAAAIPEQAASKGGCSQDWLPTQGTCGEYYCVTQFIEAIVAQTLNLPRRHSGRITGTEQYGEENAMQEFIDKYREQIDGTLSAFDRLVLRDSLRRLNSGYWDQGLQSVVALGMEQYLGRWKPEQPAGNRSQPRLAAHWR